MADSDVEAFTVDIGGSAQHDHGNHAHESGPMRSVDEVRDMILQRVRTLAPIELHLQEAYGCVLASDVAAELDIPAFSSSAMDGFAVRASDVSAAMVDEPVTLRVVGRAPVGQPPGGTVGSGEAIRIATGAPVPAGADSIVPIEHCVVEGETVHVLKAFGEGANVRPAGEDVRAGSVLVPAGRRLAAPELGMLANSGHASVLVHPRPRVVVISTGDELVEPGRPAPFGMVRDANSFTLYGGLRDVGTVPYLAGIIRDDADVFKDEVVGLAARADCFISSGGVSVGERDVVKKAFFRRGEIDFYRVAMQPGMPQGFGAIDGVPYFGLPGNPVSVFVSFEVFIRPALLKMMGRRDIFRPEIYAVLESDITGPRDKVMFARVRVWREKGQWRAASTGPPGSNLLGTVTKANGLAVIPVGIDSAQAGSRVRVMLFRALEEEP
ncbi:MAG TPA: gephyrin-like molybdotransferase Glp [Actinomycetota bacterium]|nr:gephyrin-like molybdotransferase Glp [Actinomycetota bacterium]